MHLTVKSNTVPKNPQGFGAQSSGTIEAVLDIWDCSVLPPVSQYSLDGWSGMK